MPVHQENTIAHCFDILSALKSVSFADYKFIFIINLFKTYIFCFSNTYTEVQKRADTIWKVKRYYLIRDYEQRVFLPSPLSLPLNVYQFFLFIRSRIEETDQGHPGQGKFYVKHVQTG